MHAFRCLLLLASLWLLGCERGAPQTPADAGEPLVRFDSARACIFTAVDTLRLSVELAETPQQRAYGLMERDRLDPDAGMLFTYAEQQPAGGGFWMFRTRVPLDIAYLDSAGTILSIHPMRPCASPDPRWCPSYPAGASYQGALEVNQGWFAAHGVRRGDRVVREGEPGCPRG